MAIFNVTCRSDFYVHVTFSFAKVFIWSASTEVATVDQLKQSYVICPPLVRDGYLIETIRTFRSQDENGLIMIFTDTCK